MSFLEILGPAMWSWGCGVGYFHSMDGAIGPTDVLFALEVGLGACCGGCSAEDESKSCFCQYGHDAERRLMERCRGTNEEALGH